MEPRLPEVSSMRQLERYWRPWRNANQGSMRARSRRLSGGFSQEITVAGTAAPGVADRPEIREVGRATGSFFPWCLADDEPEPA
jgi:hypothetical protein